MIRNSRSAQARPHESLPKLNVPRSEAQRRLEDHIAKGREIVNRPINSQEEMDQADADGDKWWNYAIRLLSILFNNTSVADEYQGKTREIAVSGKLPYIKARDIFKSWMDYRVREGESSLESLELYDESPPPPIAIQRHASTDNTARSPQADALEKIERIAHRFDIVARQLRRRYKNRATLTIEDEYDIQELFHALLRLFFDDVRPEEWTPSYAGGNSRIDFLLNSEQIVVELKMTRNGLNAREVSNQLNIAIGRYRSHPDCKTLVAFLYDPEQYIDNPKGVEDDLSRAREDMLVKVIITPR